MSPDVFRSIQTREEVLRWMAGEPSAGLDFYEPSAAPLSADFVALEPAEAPSSNHL